MRSSASRRRTSLAVAGAVLAAAGGAAWWASRPPAVAYGPDGRLRPDILVLDIDSLSPERVGFVRDGASVTPTLDALGKRGTVFTQAYSQSGWTLPALGSVLSGRLPVPVEAHGGVAEWRPPGERSLPAILSLYGYTTAAWWGDTLPGPSGSAVSGGFARTVSDGPVVPTLDLPEPWFAYVHTLDLNHPWAYRQPSYPYEAPHANAIGKTYAELWASYQSRLQPAAARAAMLAHHDAILHLYDADLASLFAQLDRARTIVVFTSDHGQDFFHHAYGDHGLLYDTTLHVPLVVVDPRKPPHAPVDTVVQGVDLAPTLLDLAGIPADATMDGRSFAALLGADSAPYTARPVYSLTDGCHLALRADGWKLVLRDGRARPDRSWMPAGDARGTRLPLPDWAARHGLTDLVLPDCSGQAASLANVKDRGTGVAGAGPSDVLIELYALATDPDEQQNLAEEQPDRAATMLRALLAARTATEGGGREALSPAQVEALRAQGYWGFVAPGP